MMKRREAINAAAFAGLVIGSLAIGASRNPLGWQDLVSLLLAVSIPVCIVQYAVGKR